MFLEVEQGNFLFLFPPCELILDPDGLLWSFYDLLELYFSVETDEVPSGLLKTSRVGGYEFLRFWIR